MLWLVEDVKEHEKKQQELHDLIVSVFRLRRRLSYFQVCDWFELVHYVLGLMSQRLCLVRDITILCRSCF